ncbi:hypothetical protein NQ314_000535 [Rhamnusium bicolor]|uniref:THAP-type domain-containing protein n=1 Tax=Rhamnusium bicolor TaxID=1586634 RepID=A0AAV8ZUK1_9CUCU|nr:hypothetical protein NQ314_000535 [Rhamnusium bicolor]
MGKSCLICNNRFEKGSNKSFHTFPRELNMKKLWCQITDLNMEEVSPYDVLCSDHFSSEEIYQKSFTGKNFLKKGAMPSVATSSKIQKVLFIRVQFMPDVTKHVSIVETSSESDGLGEEEIPKKRRKPLPRYFGDCSSDDMKSPRRAKRSWAIATKTISQLKARVRKFRRENYILKSRDQEIGETVDQFVTALRQLASICEFMEKYVLVPGIEDLRTRETLLQNTDLNLNEAIQICRSMETSVATQKEITGSEKMSGCAVKNHYKDRHYSGHGNKSAGSISWKFKQAVGRESDFNGKSSYGKAAI